MVNSFRTVVLSMFYILCLAAIQPVRLQLFLSLTEELKVPMKASTWNNLSTLLQLSLVRISVNNTRNQHC